MKIRNVIIKILSITIGSILYLLLCLVTILYRFIGNYLHIVVILGAAVSFISAYSSYIHDLVIRCVMLSALGTFLLLFDILIIPECLRLEAFMKEFVRFAFVSSSDQVEFFFRWNLFLKRRQTKKQKGNQTEEAARKKEYQGQSQQQSGQSSSFAAAEMDFFAGTTTKEEVKARYRSLLKIYHPDNQNGDTTMSTQIQKQYERKCKEL